MKQIISIILLISSLAASQKMTMQELLIIASHHYKKPVVLSSNLEKELYVYSNITLNTQTAQTILKRVLKNNGLILADYESYYVIESIEDIKETNFYIGIKYLSKEDIKSIMSHYNIKYTFINNKIMFSCLPAVFTKIKNTFNVYDKPKKQKKFKLTVLETNVNKLNELGTKYSLQKNSNNILNLALGNVSFSSSPQLNKTLSAELKALVTDGITKIVTNPTLTIRDREKTVFNLTRTIPVSQGTTTIENSSITTVQNTSYKSYGLKINVEPIMLDKSTDITLSLVLEDIINNTNDKPSTSDKVIEQKIIIRDNELYSLSGFSKKIKVDNNEGVPILKDVPIMGYFFKWDTKEDINVELQIMIEIID